MATTGGAEFAQAYVMSKLHREKTERLRQQEMESNRDGPSAMMKMSKNHTSKSSGGFFGTMRRKKVHPNGPVAAGAAGAAVTGW